MNGTVVDSNIFDNTASPVCAYTPVMMRGDQIDGQRIEGIRPHDLQLDQTGALAATWCGGNGTWVSHFYGRWIPSNQTWVVNHLAFRGSWYTHPKQQDGIEDHRGTPLSAVNPNNVSAVYFSSHADPETNNEIMSSTTGRPMQEIYKATTSNYGASWTYKAITSNSSSHNFRLTVLDWDEENTVVMWMRGYYDLWYFGQGWDGGQNWDGWDTALVAYLDRRRERPSPLIYVPINVSTDTGEPSSPVAYTPAVDAGAYDVYVLFWSRPTDDDGIMAGLSPSSLMMFERQGCQHVFASDFVTEQDVVVSNDIDLHLYRGYIGRVEVNATRSIKVYMHQLPGEEGANRTWFDGIALRRLPGDSEPASSVAYGRLRVEARSRGNRDLKSKLGVCHVLVVFVTVLPICQLYWSNMEHR